MVHVTAVLLVSMTVAANCCCWLPLVSVAVAGVTLTATGGINVTVADAVKFEFAWLVAVTTTVCCVVMLAGAVYRPVWSMAPAPAGKIVQMTGVEQLFSTDRKSTRLNSSHRCIS